jgi:O-antigen/teichoic acid export membrane protein
MKRNSLLKNIIFGFLSWFLPLGLSFVATPIILHGLGIEKYGLYTLVLGFISYSFTFNIGKAIVKYVSEFQATGQTEKISEIISATLLLNLIVGGTGMTLLLLLSKWFVASVLQIEMELQDEAVTAFHLAAALILATMFSQVFSSIIQAIHRFDVYSYITIATNCLLAAGNILLALANQKIEILLIWSLLLTVLNSLIFYFYARRLLPEFNLKIVFPKEILRLILRYSAAIIVTQFLGNFLLLFERSWIANRLGTEAVAYYVIALNLGVYVHAFIGSISLALFPLSSEIEAQGDKNKLLRVYIKATKIVLMLAAFLCLTLINGRDFILGLWVGLDFVEKSSGTLIAHALTFSILAVVIISVQIIEGVGSPGVTAAAAFVWLVLSVPLMIFLTDDYGIAGVGIARMVGASVFIPTILYIEAKVFGRIQWEFWRRNLFIVGLSSITASVVQYFAFQNLAMSWVNFGGGAIISGLVFGFCLLIAGFVSPNEKEWLKNKFNRSVFNFT